MGMCCMQWTNVTARPLANAVTHPVPYWTSCTPTNLTSMMITHLNRDQSETEAAEYYHQPAQNVCGSVFVSDKFNTDRNNKYIHNSERKCHGKWSLRKYLSNVDLSEHSQGVSNNWLDRAQLVKKLSTFTMALHLSPASARQISTSCLTLFL
jgi:hypothetical protein